MVITTSCNLLVLCFASPDKFIWPQSDGMIWFGVHGGSTGHFCSLAAPPFRDHFTNFTKGPGPVMLKIKIWLRGKFWRHLYQCACEHSFAGGKCSEILHWLQSNTGHPFWTKLGQWPSHICRRLSKDNFLRHTLNLFSYAENINASNSDW